MLHNFVNKLLHPMQSQTLRTGANPLAGDPNAAFDVLATTPQRPVAVPVMLEPDSVDKPAGALRFVCISDTHNKHDKIELPRGDVLLHAGDFSGTGTLDEVKRFSSWLGSLGDRYKHKIVIAGNHDLPFDVKAYPTIGHQ